MRCRSIYRIFLFLGGGFKVGCVVMLHALLITCKIFRGLSMITHTAGVGCEQDTVTSKVLGLHEGAQISVESTFSDSTGNPKK